MSQIIRIGRCLGPVNQDSSSNCEVSVGSVICTAFVDLHIYVLLLRLSMLYLQLPIIYNEINYSYLDWAIPAL